MFNEAPNPFADALSETHRIRVLVAHSHPLVAAGIASTLGQQNDIEVSICQTAELQASDGAPDDEVDVLISDHGEGSRFLSSLSQFGRPLVRDLPVACREEELVTAVRTLRRGHLFLSGAVSPRRSAMAPTSRKPGSVVRGGLAPGVLRRVRELIELELENNIALSSIAMTAGLSVYHFARAFKQSMGVSPHRYLLQRRIEKAVALLKETELPLSEIAVTVGFADQSHFSRQFSRFMGETPRAFRHAER